MHSLIPHWRYLWLVTASFIAGAMNAMAGGGSFVSFPAMLALGVPPVEANATNTVALWPGQLTSAAALRQDLRPDRYPTLLPVIIVTSLVGGIAGAAILLHTSQRTFALLIPWLILTGALLFWVSAPISKWLRARAAHTSPHHHIPALPLALALLPVTFYIGYFGAGSGFLIMTVLALFGLDDMRQLNALKVVAAGASNLFAIAAFIVSGRVLWHYCLISMLFAALGGFAGARYARRMNPTILRSVVVLTGLAIAAYFFWKQR
jgi:uncharacterized membrane protein YfcA